MRKNRLFLILVALFAFAQGAWAQTTYITDVMVAGADPRPTQIINDSVSAGWTLIDYDLNLDVGGSYIYLLYLMANMTITLLVSIPSAAAKTEVTSTAAVS